MRIFKLFKGFCISAIIYVLFSTVGVSQVITNDSLGRYTWHIDSLDRNNPWLTEAGGYTGKAKSVKIHPCKSHLEANEMVTMMDTGTVYVDIKFFCLCSDYLIDVNVKLSNGLNTYNSITDKFGCKFLHISSGSYKLEVVYKYAKRFKPIHVELKSGGIYKWEIFLCEN